MNLTQKVCFQNGTLVLNSTISSLTLINIEMQFDENQILQSFLIIGNKFCLELQVKIKKNN